MADAHPDGPPSLPITFVLRLGQAEPELSGVIELVRTGEKHRFEGAEALGSLIARMAALARAAMSEADPWPEGGPS
jgi:hypothetical protein